MFKLFNKKKPKKFDNQPFGTEAVVNIADVIVPNDFFTTQPKESKLEKFRALYEVFGYLDKPISVCAETNERGKPNKLIIRNGYARYIIAKENNLSKIPIKYIEVI